MQPSATSNKVQKYGLMNCGALIGFKNQGLRINFHCLWITLTAPFLFPRNKMQPLRLMLELRD